MIFILGIICFGLVCLYIALYRLWETAEEANEELVEALIKYEGSEDSDDEIP